MQVRGATKQVAKLNFWGEYKQNIPENIQEFIVEQYLDAEELVVYCDGSIVRSDTRGAVGVAYVGNASVYTKGKLITIDRELINKNHTAELEALLFVLDNFKKYVSPQTTKVTIYSDVFNIGKQLRGESTYQNEALEKIRVKLVTQYNKTREGFPNLEIKYLDKYYRYANPFYKSAHNTAKGLLGK